MTAGAGAAAGGIARAAGHRPQQPLRRAIVPAGHHSPHGSRQGLRDHHRGLQRILQFLRGPVHAGSRADAAKGRDSGRKSAQAAASGCKEVQLLGQIVNHYQAPDDPACDFRALLEAVHDITGIERIRFASPHPRAHERSPDRGRAIATAKVCEHLHLPVQSGSTRVLSLMRRRYTPREYLERDREDPARLSRTLRLSTDMIVGFPGNGRRTSRRRLSLTGAVGFHSMFSFKYSERPNTLASRAMPDDVTGGGEDEADCGAAGDAAPDSWGLLEQASARTVRSWWTTRASRRRMGVCRTHRTAIRW